MEELLFLLLNNALEFNLSIRPVAQSSTGEVHQLISLFLLFQRDLLYGEKER